MNLQILLNDAVEISNLGKLAILGVVVSLQKAKVRKTATFALLYSVYSPFAGYVKEGGCIGSLLESIRQGQPPVDLLPEDGQRLLIFTHGIQEKQCDWRKLLRNTARELAEEINKEEVIFLNNVQTEARDYHLSKRQVAELFARKCHANVVDDRPDWRDAVSQEDIDTATGADRDWPLTIVPMPKTPVSLRRRLG